MAMSLDPSHSQPQEWILQATRSHLYLLRWNVSRPNNLQKLSSKPRHSLERLTTVWNVSMWNKPAVKRKRYIIAESITEIHCIGVRYIVYASKIAVDKQTWCVKGLGEEGEVTYLWKKTGLVWSLGTFKKIHTTSYRHHRVNISPGSAKCQFTHIKDFSPAEALPPD
jgi:hypothetical protein